jgi:MFS family permease
MRIFPANGSRRRSDAEPPVANPANLPLVRARLKTPRAAAIAGILFSVLLIYSLWLLRLSIPADPLETGAWLETSAKRVSFALNLIPIAGIAFMWFIGVLRDRLGRQEDQFFATVFLGSGLLCLGMLFVAAAATGGLIRAYAAQQQAMFDGATFAFGRAFVFDIMHMYAFKMAAVFMMIASTLALRTRITARWIALLGYASAAFLLIGSNYFDWTLFVFPAWVLLVSGYILVDNFRSGAPMVSREDAG